MIEYVCTPIPVRIAQQGCHGNHGFSHSPNEFMFRKIFFSFMGAQDFFWHQRKIVMGMQGRSN